MLEPGWDLYRSFLAVLREGSLSRAARLLGLTQPTVGRHVAELEALLDLRLFTRANDGLRPTDAALELRPYAEALEATAASLLRTAAGQGDGVRGPVRISASEVVGVEVLPPILARLRERHPELVIELVLSNSLDDLLRRAADVAVRMVRPTQAALVARSVGAVPLGLHAHRRYLERHGRPTRWEALEGHSLIGFDRETPAIRAVLARAPELTRARFAFRADSDLAQLAAIRAGYGIGVCQVGLARREADLVRVLPEFQLDLDTWVAMHEDLKANRRCRTVFDALVEGLADYVRG